MTPHISKFIADLYETDEQIVVYGNFSIYKKTLSLPNHLANQMGKTELLEYALANGEWQPVQEINGYNVHEIKVGSGRLFVAFGNDEIRFILGA